MKRIVTSRGFEALVDDADYPALADVRWGAIRIGGGGRIPHYRPGRVIRDAEGQRTVFLYNVILPKREGLVVDHINGDPWDNRRENLRYCTLAENSLNRPRYRNKTLPYKGIHKKRNRYFASVTMQGRSHWSRGFYTMEEAARAYDALAIEWHGEFANLNFPDERAA